MRFLTPVLALVAASAAAAAVTHVRQPAPHGSLELVASVKKRIGVRGVPVTGLYPGAARSLTVKVTNPYAFPIKVAPLRAKVRSSNRAGCTGAASNLTVVAASPRSAAIRARASKSVVLRVTMPGTVANACQGATFALSFSARATRA
jgi:hypothetical protein